MSLDRLPIPETKNFTIDVNGEVYDPEGYVVPREVTKDGTVRVRVFTTYWKDAWRSVARLMLQTFDPIENSDWCSVVFRDGNSQNVKLENLEWDWGMYIPTRIPGITAPFGSFVEIPGFRKYSINMTGAVEFTKTRHMLRQDRDKRGCPAVKLYDDNGVLKNMAVYRLMALTFLKHPKDTSHLVINHIDGNPLNSDLLNIEWTTYSLNNRHAFETGLRPAKQVLLKNLETGKVSHYATLRLAAESLGLKPNNLHQYVAGKGSFREFSPVKGHLVKYADDQTPWPTATEMRQRPSSISAGQMIVKNIKTGEVKVYQGARAIEDAYGYNFSTIQKIALRTEPGYPEVYQDIMIQPYDGSPVSWPEYPPEIIQVFHSMKNQSNPVKVTDLRDNSVSYWAGVKYWYRDKCDTEDLNDPAVICRSLKVNPVYKHWKFEFINLKDYAYPSKK